MMTFIPPRLRKPLVYVLAGTRRRRVGRAGRPQRGFCRS